MAEVEAQTVGADERARLFDVLAEHLAQGVVEDVGASVVAANGGAPTHVDGRRGGGPGDDAAPDNTGGVSPETWQGEGGVDHLGLT